MSSTDFDQATADPLQVVLQTVPSLLGYWDRHLRCRYANAAYQRWFNIQNSVLFDLSLKEFMGPDVWARNEPHVLAVLAGEPQEFDITMSCFNGNRPARVAYWPHTVEGEVLGFVVQAIDLSTLHASSHNAEQFEDALSQGRRLEVLGQLAGGISHDFNNVLATVSSVMQLLKLSTQEPRSRSLAEQGQRAVQRAANLVSQLLDVARPKASQVQVVDLARLVRSCEEIFRVSAGPRVKLDIGATRPRFSRVDPSQLEIAVLNLVVNARDAMPAGGRLSLEVLAGPGAQLAHGWSDESVEIRVRDTGTGMSPETLAKATEPFFTTKAPGAGTGIGLAMVDATVRRAGGVLILESQEGAGTTVRLLLPPSPTPAAELEHPEPVAVDARLHGDATILVLDDDAMSRPLLAGYLRELGYTVFEAMSPKEGLSLARAFGEELALVLACVEMREMSADEFALRLRSHSPSAGVLGMSADSAGELRGQPVLVKPFQLDEVARRVLQALGRMPSSP